MYGHEDDTLTIEEMKYVRMHADLSARILEENGYPSDLVEWVHCITRIVTDPVTPET